MLANIRRAALKEWRKRCIFAKLNVVSWLDPNKAISCYLEGEITVNNLLFY